MLAALLAGDRRPAVLAQLARTRMRPEIKLLEEAFAGQFTEHHAFLLRLTLARLADTLLIDGDGVDDPTDFNDRLLLGLKGTP